MENPSRSCKLASLHQEADAPLLDTSLEGRFYDSCAGSPCRSVITDEEKNRGPIIFINAGEVDTAPYYGYVTNSTINGVIAQTFGDAAIVLEHPLLWRE
ncbi:hypothetical protein ARMSODRAFT_1020094 [Armillaria solidipes]|uniref:Uncharacterized protein n=1 Tax=Armillaria solidipes TaxID=1076256 RepID=A0A2H3BYE2_9AGAR|nr:hypothetical protein ARMSODRAFT_1020094 [Armillaria solidipes]